MKPEKDKILTEEELKTHCEVLAKTHKCKKVIPLHLINDEEDNGIYVFFKQANSYTKMQCIDLLFQSPMKAGKLLFEATVIREESDPQVFKQDNDDDEYYLGAIMFCVGKIRAAGAYQKKN